MSKVKAKVLKFATHALLVLYMLNIVAPMLISAEDTVVSESFYTTEEFQTTEDSPVTVTKDENGWSQLAFKEGISTGDIQVLYVSTTNEDGGAGLETNPYSLAKLNEFINNKNNTQHLVIRFKCGDVFEEAGNITVTSAYEGALDRVLIFTYYGDERLGRPKFTTKSSSFIFLNGLAKNNIFCIGLEFERTYLLNETELPEGNYKGMPYIVGGGGGDKGEGVKNILFEDCKFNYAPVYIMGSIATFYATNIGFRRNIFDKNYAIGSFGGTFTSNELSTGISISKARDVLIEDNVFIDIGWSEKMMVKNAAGFSNNSGKINAIRLYDDVLNPIVKGNIVFNPANVGIYSTGGAIIKDNFISRANQAMVVADDQARSFGDDLQILVSDNVVTEGRVWDPYPYLKETPPVSNAVYALNTIVKAGQDGLIYNGHPLVEGNLVFNRLTDYAVDFDLNVFNASLHTGSALVGTCVPANYKNNLAYNWATTGGAPQEMAKPEETGLDEEWLDENANLRKYNSQVLKNEDYAAIHAEIEEKILTRVRTRFENTVLEPQFKNTYEGSDYETDLAAHIAGFFNFVETPGNEETFTAFLEYYTFIEMCALREVGQWLPAYSATDVNKYFRACFNPKLQAKLTLGDITEDDTKKLNIEAEIGAIVKIPNSLVLVGERDASGNVVRLTKKDIELVYHEAATNKDSLKKLYRLNKLSISIELPDDFDDSNYFVLLWDKDTMTPLSYSVSPQ